MPGCADRVRGAANMAVGLHRSKSERGERSE